MENFEIHDCSCEHIGHEHMIECEHVQPELSCTRPEPYDVHMYEAAMERYHRKLKEYRELNWMKRLFTKKPVEPNLEDYIYFY